MNILYAVARTVLLDALEALNEQRDAVVLVGAQAIYLHTGDAEIAVPAFTTDGDLVIEPARLKDEPRLVEAIRSAADGNVPPAVAALAQGVAVNGLFKKALLLAVAIVAAATIGVGVGEPRTSTAGPPAEKTPPAKSNAKAKKAPADRPAKAEKMQTIAGKVLDPAGFLAESARCVRAGGALVMIEPWVSRWSRFVYTRFHHEPFDPDSPRWEVPQTGPLSGANGALPWILFTVVVYLFAFAGGFVQTWGRDYSLTLNHSGRPSRRSGGSSAWCGPAPRGTRCGPR